MGRGLAAAVREAHQPRFGARLAGEAAAEREKLRWGGSGWDKAGMGVAVSIFPSSGSIILILWKRAKDILRMLSAQTFGLELEIFVIVVVASSSGEGRVSFSLIFPTLDIVDFLAQSISNHFLYSPTCSRFLVIVYPCALLSFQCISLFVYILSSQFLYPLIYLSAIPVESLVNTLKSVYSPRRFGS